MGAVTSACTGINGFFSRVSLAGYVRLPVGPAMQIRDALRGIERHSDAAETKDLTRKTALSTLFADETHDLAVCPFVR